MKIYKLVWYLELEDQLKEKLITDRDVAEEYYQDLKKCLYRGCWLYLIELEENKNHELTVGEAIHSNDI